MLALAFACSGATMLYIALVVLKTSLILLSGMIQLGSLPLLYGHTIIGRSSFPKIFFNDRLIGGFDDLEELDRTGELDKQIQECLKGPNVEFPPAYRKPNSEEFLRVSIAQEVMCVFLMYEHNFFSLPAHSYRTTGEMAEGSGSH